MRSFCEDHAEVADEEIEDRAIEKSDHCSSGASQFTAATRGEVAANTSR